MKVLLVILVSFCFSAFATPNHQKVVDDFFANHVVAKSYMFCRSDVPTLECRSLMQFKNNTTGEIVEAFQMAFFAPSKQGVGTELFLPVDDASEGFQQYIDKSFDGKFVAEVGEVLPIAVGDTAITISNWKPAPGVVAQLHFGSDRAVLEGIMTKPDGSTQQVNLVYDLLR